MDVVNEFNTTCSMFLDLMYSFTNDSDISFYKKAMHKMIEVEKIKIIEQFIIHCLIYNEHIQNKNINYFMNVELKDKVKADDTRSLLNIIKIKDLIKKFDENQINLMFDYLQLLCNFGIEYLNNKVK